MTDLRHKNVLITGAASGLGRRMALDVAARGGRIIAWDINRAGLDALLEEIRGLDAPDPYADLCDISDREAIYAAAARVEAAVGPVDVLINNAGIVSGAPFLELPDEKIEASFAINSLALFWTAKAFLPGMIARGAGHVVTVASAAGTIGVCKLTDYSASKFAAVGFDESLRMELRRTAPGVKTTLVCPYYINTGMFEGVKTRFPLLLPILDEAKVARKIVRAIEKGRARVITPLMVHLVPLLRPLPPRIFDAIADFFGINASMKDFIGRRPPRALPQPAEPPEEVGASIAR